eukprot:TRINITY_DN17138_c0_g1_i1.p1 TRINITY_DN17138_c0_g1~~TRINITY_DN17138_c0_g1_i1.p1  ORF type:complete len:831 (+),score=186.89 TRINITY_DN17138_c0_g1_i1:50-2542(+)
MPGAYWQTGCWTDRTRVQDPEQQPGAGHLDSESRSIFPVTPSALAGDERVPVSPGAVETPGVWQRRSAAEQRVRAAGPRQMLAWAKTQKRLRDARDGAPQPPVSPTPKQPSSPPPPPAAAPPVPGMRDFNGALTDALTALPGDTLPEKWISAAQRLQRCALWTDYDGTATAEDVTELLECGQEQFGTEDSLPSAELVAGACAGLSRMLQLLCEFVPNLRQLADEVLEVALRAVYVEPPAVFKMSKNMESRRRKSTVSLRKACQGSLMWCQQTDRRGKTTSASAIVMDESGERGQFLQSAGVAPLLREAIAELSLQRPSDACAWFADHFHWKATRPVDVADARVAVDGRLVVYLSRQHALQATGQRKDAADAATEQVLACAASSDFSIARAGASRAASYCPATLDPPRMLPTSKRLGYTFLCLLNRDRKGNAKADQPVPGVPWVSLVAPLQEWCDKGRDRTLTVSAEAVESTAGAAPPGADPEYASAHDGGRGPPARKVYGTEQFVMTRDDVLQLEQSTRVTVTGHLTVRFAVELSRLCNEPGTLWFYNLFRAVPLLDIGSPQATATLQKTLSDHWQSERLACMTLDGELEQLRKQVEAAKRQGKLHGGMADLLNRKESEQHQRKTWRDASQARLGLLRREADIERLSTRLQAWLQCVLRQAKEYGYDGRNGALRAAMLSLTELASMYCVSQQGYFFVRGSDGAQNQITAKTPEPLLFLSTAGVDFGSPSATALEASKYFKRPPCPPGTPGCKGWKGWQPGAEMRLQSRLRDLFTVLFSAAQNGNTRSLLVGSVGLGCCCCGACVYATLLHSTQLVRKPRRGGRPTAEHMQ